MTLRLAASTAQAGSSPKPSTCRAGQQAWVRMDPDDVVIDGSMRRLRGPREPGRCAARLRGRKTVLPGEDRPWRRRHGWLPCQRCRHERAPTAGRPHREHPRAPAAGDRPGPATAGRTRHHQGGAGQELAAGGRADRRPPRPRLRLPAGRPARHRSQPAALPGAAGLRRGRHHRAVPAHPGRAGHRRGQPQRPADPGRRPRLLRRPGHPGLPDRLLRVPLLAGPPAYLLFRHRYGRPAPGSPRRARPRFTA